MIGRGSERRSEDDQYVEPRGNSSGKESITFGNVKGEFGR